MGFEKKAVIFDLDGVVCVTDKFHHQVWKALTDRLGIYFDEKINNCLRGTSHMASLDFILGQIGLGDFFDATADGTDITHSKPDPEVFLISAKKIGINPADCVVVEDAKAGIEAAKAGGMTALALFDDARIIAL